MVFSYWEKCHSAGETWKNVTVAVGLWSSRDCDAEEHVSRDGKQRGPRMEKDSRDQGERTSRTTEEIMSVRTLEGFVRKSTWQVADVRRSLVSASHIIQAGNDLFVGKGEAYNRKKKEKSMPRRKGTCTCLICS